DRRAEAIDQHVRRGDHEVVLCELVAELPLPCYALFARKRFSDAPLRDLIDAFALLRARADQTTDYLHVGSVQVVRMRDLDDRKARERERRRRIAERLVVRDVKFDAAVDPVAEPMRELDVADVALFLRDEAPEAAEIELAKPERDVADRR